MTENQIEQQLREEIESIDWDAIREQSLHEHIGIELFEGSLETLGYENSVAVVAVVMDGFRANHSARLAAGTRRNIANGFAHALMRDHIAESLDDDEEGTE